MAISIIYKRNYCCTWETEAEHVFTLFCPHCLLPDMYAASYGLVCQCSSCHKYFQVAPELVNSVEGKWDVRYKEDWMLSTKEALNIMDRPDMFVSYSPNMWRDINEQYSYERKLKYELAEQKRKEEDFKFFQKVFIVAAFVLAILLYFR